jgi:RNA-directed DNA polymerase
MSKQGIETQIRIEAERQTKYRELHWEWVEGSIWTDNMLIALDNGVKGRKWFSLIDKVQRMRTLEIAWHKVKLNKGAAGIDKVSIERFQENAAKYLQEIEVTLKEAAYQPQAVRRVYIPKGSGKMRPLGIPTIKDRIVQMAIKMVIEPIFEREFLSISYGFRPGRDAKDALREVERLLKEGYTWVVDADLRSYFDTIPHNALMMDIKERISDGRILDLIESYLKQKICEEMKEWTPLMGTPQGAVLSPLLGNIYLHPLDQLMQNEGFKMIRFADDYVILSKSQEEAKRAFEIVQQWTKARGLELNLEKTHIGDCMEEGEGFEFLGYRFEVGRRMVRKKSLERFKEKIRTSTKRTCGQSIETVIEMINPAIRGWYNYFKQAHKSTFRNLDGFIRRRLRAILRRQERRPSFGISLENSRRWPNRYFANLGLFTMETHRAVEVANQSRCRNY